MDDNNPGATSLEPAATPAPYKDRSTGLMVFGIMTILLGCLSALMVPFMLFGMAAARAAAPMPLSSILAGASVYGALAVALVWLGIGSIRARRWARALLLIFSWSWLIVGIVAMLAMGIVLPKSLANASSHATHPMSGAVIAGVMIFMYFFLGFFFILLPAAWIFFYRSPQVKATCEARDPVARWTDACPLPVLAQSLWLVSCLPTMLLMTLTGHAVMPFFGTFLNGIPGSIFSLAMVAIWFYCAWSLFKLEARGWWLTLAVLCVFTASGFITFARHDIVEMYQLMGYPESRIEHLQQSGLLEGNRVMWLMGGASLPFIGYLLYIKKYFASKS